MWVKAKSLSKRKQRFTSLPKMDQRIAEIAVCDSQIAIQRDSGLIREYGLGELTTRHMKQAACEMSTSVVLVECYGRFRCLRPSSQRIVLDLRRHRSVHLDQLQKDCSCETSVGFAVVWIEKDRVTKEKFLLLQIVEGLRQIRNRDPSHQ